MAFNYTPRLSCLHFVRSCFISFNSLHFDNGVVGEVATAIFKLLKMVNGIETLMEPFREPPERIRDFHILCTSGHHLSLVLLLKNNFSSSGFIH